jgi:outer membrane protein OmpA-like peptidoglycan-associated protein
MVPLEPHRRAEGLLSLESYMAAKDPFAVKGLQLLVDGAEPDRLREVLEVEITAMKRVSRQRPASGNPPAATRRRRHPGRRDRPHPRDGKPLRSDQAGRGIAVAFVATIYGVGAANLIFLPIAASCWPCIAQLITHARDVRRWPGRHRQRRQSTRIIESRLLLFGAGDATLQPAAQDIIAAIARVLLYTDFPLVVEGHTDNSPVSGRLVSNWALSALRAAAVTGVFADQGILSTRLTASGLADQRPVADNTSEEGRARNRRVSIRIETFSNEPAQSGGQPATGPVEVPEGSLGSSFPRL